MNLQFSKCRVLATLGPGMLIAATGVGAGDLATAAFAGTRLGIAVLWAAALGAFLKFVLNEGLARWQLATGETLLEGAMTRVGRPLQFVFMGYLLLWSYFTGSAMMSACGATAHAMFPVFESAQHGKIVFGGLASIAGTVLVLVGGYRLFSVVMSACIAFMFGTVLLTVVLLKPDWSAVLSGLLIPRIPHDHGQGLSWTIALMGGIGGTLTVLCYGYWIREEGRTGGADLRLSRIDLAVGYTMTALFGIAMVIIGGTIDVSGKDSALVVTLASSLGTTLGPFGKWCFLIGAWGAVFSSLLGVWQSAPYIFADSISLMLREPKEARRKRVATASRTYRAFLLAIALIPMAGLFTRFETVQKAYAIFGAGFMPLLALTLVYLNGSTRWVGPQFRNHPATTMLLLGILVFFCLAGYYEISTG